MRHTRLSRLAEINSKLLKNADDKISRAKELLNIEFDKLKQLVQYRDFYVDALRKRMNNSTAPEVLRHYLSFIAGLEQNIQRQQQSIEGRKNNYQQLLQSRQQMYRQHKPVELVSEKLLSRHQQKKRCISTTENEDICIAHFYRRNRPD